MDFHSTFIPALVAYAIKDDSFNMHKGKWMVEGTLSALLLNHYNIDKELSFTEDILVNALGQNNIINLRKHNLAGVHESLERNMSRLHAVDHRQKGQRRRRVYYIEMKPFVPRRSNRLKRVHDEVSNTLPAIVSPTPTKKTRRRSSQLQVTDLSHTSVSSIILFLSPRNHFRNVKTDLVVNSSDRVWFKELLQLHINTLEQIQGSNCTPIEIVDAELQNQMTDAKHKKIADRIREEVIQSISNGKYKAGGPSIYWYSTEAKNLFCPDNKEFGGKQRLIHDSLLTKGCLGTYNPKFKVGDTQSFTFCESSSGPFFMSPLERETLENGDLHDSKFVPIPKNVLLQRLFEKGLFINLDTIRIANCEFRIDHQNRMLYGKDKKLSANEIRSLCEDRHIDPHAFQQQRPSNNTLQALVKHLIDNIPLHETVKFQNRMVHIDRLNNCIWKRNNIIPTMYVRKLCRENDVEWKLQKPCVSNSKEVDKSIKELLKDLTNDGHFIPRNRMKKADLISFATKYDIPIKKTVETQVTEGWVGKAKGKLQIAFERGLLNLEKYCVEEFSDKGKKDENGNVIRETSLNELLASCSDFIEEESMLQKNIKDLGGQCIHSPKYHCEIAGEGIEYSWGNSKMKYRRSKMIDRDSFKKFRETVEECLSRTYLTMERIRMNSRRAHEYIVAYFILSISDDNLDGGIKEFELDALKPQAASASKIEQLKERVRSHRAALDFDTGFCKATVCIKEESQK